MKKINKHLITFYAVMLTLLVFFSTLVYGDPSEKTKLTIVVQDIAGNQQAARFFLVSSRGELAAGGLFLQKKTVDVLPGSYDLVVSHGPERNFFNKRLLLEKGKPREVKVTFTHGLELAGYLSVDPLCEKKNSSDLELAKEAEDLDLVFSPSELGVGITRNPRAPGGLFYRAKLSPWSGISEQPGLLEGLWGIVLGEGGDRNQAASWWAGFGEVNSLRLDWFHLLSRGRSISLLAGSGKGNVPGFPRMYLPKGEKEDVLKSLRLGRGCVSWGIIVQLEGEGHQSGAMISSRFGEIKLHVRVMAPPWVTDGRLTIFEGGDPVISSDLKPVQSVVRLDKIFTLHSRYDTFYVATASGKGLIPYYHRSKFRPLGISVPARVDADGDGHYTPAQDYASDLISRASPSFIYKNFPEYSQDLRIQLAALPWDFVMADRFVNYASDIQVRFAALGMFRRMKFVWAPDILIRRIGMCKNNLLEMAEVVSAFAACGKSAGFDRFVRNFSLASLQSRIMAYRLLVNTATADVTWPIKWNLLGPFSDPDRHGIRGKYGPENGAIPGQKFRDYHGNNPVWIEKVAENGVVFFPRNKDAEVYFALTRLTLEKGSKLLFLLGAVDGISLWIDGDLVFEEPEKKAASIAVSRYLKRGSHKIFLKISQRSKGFGFGFRILDPQKAVVFDPGPVKK